MSTPGSRERAQGSDERELARRRFARLQGDFLGLDLIEPVLGVDGTSAPRRRVYLDTGATALMPRFVADALERYETQALANSHTSAHRGARITTREIEYARESIGRFVGAHPSEQVVLFSGNGATSGLNLLADALFPPEARLLIRGTRTRDTSLRSIYGELKDWAKGRGLDPAEILTRDLVVVSRLEHHSNILPWMRSVGPRNLRFPELTADGRLDLDDLARILEEEGPRIRLVALTGASNVTGLFPPVREVARLAHGVGASLVVDGAQWAPHAGIRLHDPEDPAGDIDYLALSGHKLYAPGSRGVLVARRDGFPGPEAVGQVGGGMVDVVFEHGFAPMPDVVHREEAGTPNIPGSIALGLVVEALMTVGMDVVEEHEQELVAYAFEHLASIDGVTLYGPDPADADRAAVFAFNVEGLPHGFVAAALSDYCNVAVRNSSFCAQLYVRHLLGGGDPDDLMGREEGSGCGTLPGMVRASSGLYTTTGDLEALADGLRFLKSHADRLSLQYDVGPGGEFLHREGSPTPDFSIRDEAARYLDLS